MRRQTKIILSALTCSLLLALVFIFFFSRKNVTLLNPLGSPNTSEVKEELVENPLNGVKMPASTYKEIFARRPLLVMVGNNYDARPQSNISKADIVYEVVAEAGITRFMPVFLQNDPEKIGPVRSIRAYFLSWIMEYGDGMVMHDGWSKSDNLDASAIDLIDKYNVRSLFRGGLYGYRDNSRLAPDNEYISSKVARDHAVTLGWEGVRVYDSWKFKEDTVKTYSTFPLASEANIIFWTADGYESKWIYDKDNNEYLKYTGGEIHKDLETGQQLRAKNVVVQFAKETAVNDEKNHLLYDNIGSGKALIFLDGHAVEATWSKADMVSRTKFYDNDGKEITFNRGVIWLAIVPDRNMDQVTYK